MPKKLSFCQIKGEVSVWNLTIIIYLRLDVVHKGLPALTLSTCEAWHSLGLDVIGTQRSIVRGSNIRHLRLAAIGNEHVMLPW